MSYFMFIYDFYFTLIIISILERKFWLRNNQFNVVP